MYIIEYMKDKDLDLKLYLIERPDHDTFYIKIGWTIIMSDAKKFMEKKKAKRYLKKKISKKEAKKCKVVKYRFF